MMNNPIDYVRASNIVAIILIAIAVFFLVKVFMLAGFVGDDAATGEILSAAMTGIMAIAVLLEIISTNSQLRTLKPAIKLVDSYAEYTTTAVGDERYITRVEIHLNIQNTSKALAYINFYCLPIGKYDSRSYEKFDLVENGRTAFHSYIAIPPDSIQSFHVAYRPSGMGFYSLSAIMRDNGKQLKDIHETTITLIGNMGSKKSRIGLHPAQRQ